MSPPFSGGGWVPLLRTYFQGGRMWIREKLLDVYSRLEKAFGPQGWWPGDGRFEIIVGAILTQNTSWANVTRALDNLKRLNRLNPEGMMELGTDELAEYIRPAGYYRQKARRLKEFLYFFQDEYGGDLDRLFSEEPRRLRERLLRVRGIGPETADSILLYAGHYPIFVVDAYTCRIFRCQGLISEEATYDEVQRLVMDNLDPDERLFNEFHALMVRLGKTHCRKAPRCRGCPLEEDRVFDIGG